MRQLSRKEKKRNSGEKNFVRAHSKPLSILIQREKAQLSGPTKKKKASGQKGAPATKENLNPSSPLRRGPVTDQIRGPKKRGERTSLRGRKGRANIPIALKGNLPRPREAIKEHRSSELGGGNSGGKEKKSVTRTKKITPPKNKTPPKKKTEKKKKKTAPPPPPRKGGRSGSRVGEERGSSYSGLQCKRANTRSERPKEKKILRSRYVGCWGRGLALVSRGVPRTERPSDSTK